MRPIHLLFLLSGLGCTSSPERAKGPDARSSSARTSVKICERTWMSRNLDVATYRNGDPIPQVRDAQEWLGLTTGAWCWYDNDSATYAATYGKLYNWYAVHDPRGLAPQGWHVPSDAEWSALEACLGPDLTGYRMRGEGWPIATTAADNNSGFDGLPGGMRSDGGAFSMLGRSAVFWTSTEGSASEAWCGRLVRYVDSEGTDAMATGVGYMSKTDGCSVRCVQDELASDPELRSDGHGT